MIFSTKKLKTNTGEVAPWTALPEAREWRAYRRMINSGSLIDVPDELLAKEYRPKRPRGRPRKKVE